MFFVIGENKPQEIVIPSYSEFEGEKYIENRCTKDIMCYGFHENGAKVILDCSDIVFHGCQIPLD